MTNPPTPSLCTEHTEPDQYGQSHPIESPELIERALKALDEEVQNNLPAEQKIHLTQAQEKCPELLTDDFKLKFLRCECYRIADAAKRYAKFWDKKVEIFGSERAYQALTLESLTEDEQRALRLEFVRLVGSKDPSGRHLLWLQANKQDWNNFDVMTMARATSYLMMAALEDLDTQKKGIVIMIYLKGEKMNQFNPTFLKIVSSAIKGALPVRVSCMHQVDPPAFVRIVWPVVLMLLGPRLRKRFFIHAGSIDKQHASLSQHGLTKDKLPIEAGGDIVMDFAGWMEQRRKDGK